MSYPTEAEAQAALEQAERARQRVIDQIGMPRWYWGGLAGCWIVLGSLADLGAPAWAVTATVVFAAAHSAVFRRLLAGRRRSGAVEVRAEVTGRRAEALVVGFLLLLVALTLVAAFTLAAADETHPVIWASVVVAVLILLGGPQVMAWIRADVSARAVDR